MNVIVVAYYTKGSLYEEHVRNLIDSLKLYNVPYRVIGIDNKGSWYQNMQYKPTFLKQMLEELHPAPIVYIDADAVFCKEPIYFDQLAKDKKISLSAHILDHNLYRRKGIPSEMLSGTVFLQNDKKCKELVEQWILKCGEDPKLWDQRALQWVMEQKDNKQCFHNLPAEYCMIFDYMSNRIKDPIIQHFQASRVYRNRAEQRIVDPSIPRVIEKNGVVKIRRIH